VDKGNQLISMLSLVVCIHVRTTTQNGLQPCIRHGAQTEAHNT
jgi:hypothetical protein